MVISHQEADEATADMGSLQDILNLQTRWTVAATVHPDAEVILNQAIIQNLLHKAIQVHPEAAVIQEAIAVIHHHPDILSPHIQAVPVHWEAAAIHIVAEAVQEAVVQYHTPPHLPPHQAQKEDS